MRKLSLTILLAVCCFFIGNAQDYRTGVGVRGGFNSGITVKHFLSSSSAVEGIISSRWRGFQLTGLYEIHKVAFSTERLKWYVGFGGHVGFYDGSRTKHYWGDDGKSYTVVGVDGIIGIEYTFEEFPFNIGLDWKPAFNFIGHSGLWADGGAISIRYLL